MSVYGLQLEVAVGTDTGEGALQRLAVAFERSGEALADFGRFVFPKLAPAMERAESEQFAEQGGGPLSGSWAALSPSYAQWKAGAAPGMPILELSGALRQALTSATAPGARRDWSASDFVFGTSGVEYASYHQMGTSRMPPRPPFDFGASFEAEMQRVTMEGLREAIKDASRGQLELEGGA